MGMGPGKQACRTCYFWVFLGPPDSPAHWSEGFDGAHYVLYHYAQGRGKAVVNAWFTSDDPEAIDGEDDAGDEGRHLFKGSALQCDAYGGYDDLFVQEGPGGAGASPWRMIRLGCWAHARRKFVEALDGPDRDEAEAVLRMIQRLYAVEDELRDAVAAGADEAAALKIRRTRSLPLAQEILRWCDARRDTFLPKSRMYKAVRYALNQDPELQRYATTAWAQIDNNAVGRCMKPVAVGRKPDSPPGLFTGSAAGGAAAAAMFSLIGSAKLHGLDPRAYLEDVFRRMRGVLKKIEAEDLTGAQADAELEPFLPDRWAPPGPDRFTQAATASGAGRVIELSE